MIRGTTPTLIFNFCDNIDLTMANRIVTTFKQGDTKLFDKEGGTVTKNTLSITFTQEETLQMTPNKYLSYQVRILIGKAAFSTPVYNTMVYDVLNSEVLNE